MNYSINNHQLEGLLHESDAAKYLGMTIAWLQKARYNGTGPKYIKVGGIYGRAVRYRISDLDEYIARNTVLTQDSEDIPI